MADAPAPEMTVAQADPQFSSLDWKTLPPFPGDLSLPQEMMRAAYCWASFMIHYHGAALAPYHAQRCVMLAIEEQNLQMQMGWAVIIEAMGDLARVAGPDDVVH